MRYFKAATVPAGQEIKLTVSGSPTKTSGGQGAGPASGVSGSVQAAKAVAGVGGLLIILFGSAMMFRKNGSASPVK
jgi:hypothetical protein